MEKRKKEVVIITVSSAVGQFYQALLYQLFGEMIAIACYNVEKDIFHEMQHADLYLVATTSSDIFEYIISLVPEKEKAVVSDVTFTKKQMEQLKRVPRGTKAMLVNLSANMAIETISTFHRLGMTHIDFYPVYPEIEAAPDLDLAITPGEKRFVPRRAKQVIDLGHRVFTANTIIEMALKLEFLWFLESDTCKSYIAQLAETDYSVDALAAKSIHTENKFEILLEALDVGIVGVTVEGRIFAFNTAAAEITNTNKKTALEEVLFSFLQPLCGQVSMVEMQQKLTRLVKWKDTHLSLTTAPIVSQEGFAGCFLLLQRFSDEENKQHNFRLQLLDRGYTTKYTFADIIGESPVMKKAKTIAEKMAQTDASILLTGESGTGKELFAHAIHHSSQRRGMPFVAVNCAALPEQLLESELFGYAEGAFTGAKRGGKLGLFEHAHKGTLFLDEIETMSPNLQAKLLRVLQEKEVMRLGENKIIRIDVRIIAASNENIREMVKKGSFRKDLYYRLNTLPIAIPPLRERGEDIFLILKAIQEQIGTKFTLTEGAKKVFLQYFWDGNVRELRNVVEYLRFMEHAFITVEDLPDTMREEQKEIESPMVNRLTPRVLSEIEDFLQLSGARKKEYCFVLHTLARAKKMNLLFGRKTIVEQAGQEGITLSEQETRTILKNLAQRELICISKGRSGSRITEKGEAILQQVLEMGIFIG